MDAPWDPGLLCDVAVAALDAEARRRDVAQEVAGLDALPELALHPLLRDGFQQAGFGAHAEVHYPGRVGRRRTEGDRCDLVLTRDPCAPLMDPAEAGTLFQTTGVPPRDAFWIEVKCVRQHAVIGGVGRPNAGYAGALGGPVAADVRRIANEPSIHAGAVLLILFSADEATGEHDIGAWAHRCLDRGLPIGAPLVRRFGVADRLGNSVCLVAMTPVRAGARAISGRSARAG
ncbi:MAG: hypothetical protein ACF8QF_06800 [Phycisphaerales bacterium]